MESREYRLLVFDKPTGRLYIHFVALPVFLPWKGYITLTYGNRMNDVFNDIPVFTSFSDETKKRQYCENVTDKIINCIIPIIREKSTAAMFAEEVKEEYKSKGQDRIFSVREDDVLYLQVYASLFIGDYKKASTSAKQYRKAIGMASFYTDEAKKNELMK